MRKSEEKIYWNSGNTDVLSLVTSEGEKVLDVGCGSGAIAKQLTAKGKVVDGITISESELNQAKSFLQNAYLYNLENGLPTEIGTNTYDYVICSHVLEHIAYPEKLLTDIGRVLKKDRFLIVALPNVFHYNSRLQLLKGDFKLEEAGVWDYTHLRWYSYRSAIKLMANHGFRAEVSTVTGQLPFNSVAKKILPLSANQFLYRCLTKISKGLFGSQLLYRFINNN